MKNPEQVINECSRVMGDYLFMLSEEKLVKDKAIRDYETEKRNYQDYLSMNQRSDSNYSEGGDYNPPPKKEMSPEEMERLIIERELREEQERKYAEAQIKAKAQAEEKKRKDEERKMAEQTKAELKKAQEEELARKKANLPEELADSDPNCVTLMARLPNGNKVRRNFSKTHMLQVLYDFVDISIAPSAPTYEILGGYPPKPLTEREKTLEEVFEGSSQENVIVKEIQ
eukprot:TRINITY_DN2839_c0_g1_i2.p1 TRINITY_DN2839_c0_g1~~TRINITY_DN2839_c0_g1_i2.p1  ORF type:complete len:228 (+),score=51.52 TRINITY_DN2839_c0_g1_i2:488-1171(+)